jgi:hypothetical protein
MTTSARDDAPQAPQSPTAAGSSAQLRPSPATSLDNRLAMVLVRARIAANILRSRRFHHALIVTAFGSVALARIGKENQVSARQRIAAWDARQLQRFEHQQERRAGRGARKAEQQFRRLERKTKVRIT